MGRTTSMIAHGVRAWLTKIVRAHPRIHSSARTLKRIRRRLFERLGSDRYSHPSYDGLDRKLLHYVPEWCGTFVEAGAYDGYWGSNTYWFERFRGWQGVLVEPLPELAKLARRERPRSQVFECALVPPDYDEDHVRIVYGGIMSVVAGAWHGKERKHAADAARSEGREASEVRVPARTLSDVLTEAGVTDIDLMTLDVEGFEAPVLRGLDIARHGPRFLLVEMLHEDPARREIEAILGHAYRYEARLSTRDHLYRRI